MHRALGMAADGHGRSNDPRKHDEDEDDSPKDQKDQKEPKDQKAEPREQPEPLKDATRTALLEGRVVLTSVTTLFGFQLNVVFTDTFANKLSELQRQVHLGALGLSALAIGVVMLPSAYGRQAEPRQVSRRFIRLTSRSLSIAMAPMLVSIAIDFELIASLIVGQGRALSKVLAVLVGVYLTVLWFVFPRVRAWQLEKRGLGPANDPAPPSSRRSTPTGG